MAKKLIPEIEVLCYPAAAITVMGTLTTGIADQIGQMLQRDRGDGGDVKDDDASSDGAWAGQDKRLHIGNEIQFVRMTGTVREGSEGAALLSGGVGGVMLRPREVFYNCVMQGNDPNAPRGAAGFPTLEWENVRSTAGTPLTNTTSGSTGGDGTSSGGTDGGSTGSGGSSDGAGAGGTSGGGGSGGGAASGGTTSGGTTTGSTVSYGPNGRWQTISCYEAPIRTRIQHTEQVANTHVQVRTARKLEADHCFRMDLGSLQVTREHKEKGRIRIAWGGGAYSWVLRQDAYSTVEKRTKDGKGWTIWRELTSMAKTTFSGDMLLRVSLAGGRMILSLGDQSVDLIDTAAVHGRDGDDVQIVPCSWAAGKISVTLYGVSATIGLARLVWKDAHNVPMKGEFGREVVRAVLTPDASKVTVDYRGFKPPGTDVKIESYKKDNVEGDLDALGYTCKMAADADGRYSPFVTSVIGLMDDIFKTLHMEPLDITPAVESWHESTAEPGTMSGAELSLKMQRDVLDLLPLPTGAPEGATWQYYLGDGLYNPISLSVRWTYDDGTVGKWVGRMRGYVYELPKSSSGYGRREMDVVVRDPIIRFCDPAGLIDNRFPPLSYLMSKGNGKPLYTAECIKEIVRLLLGNDEADRFNGNGDAKRFLPEGHPPLMGLASGIIGFRDRGTTQTTDKVPLKPPYLRHAIDWINDLAGEDAAGQGLACFFYGYANPQEDGVAAETEENTPPGGTPSVADVTWPVPVYGLIDPILANRNSWIVPDATYEGVDAEVLLGAAQVQMKAEKDFNTVFIVNNPPGINTESLPGPGCQMAKARVGGSDPRAPEKSWERTQVSQKSFETDGDDKGTAVQWMARLLIDTTEGTLPITGTLSMPQAEPRMQWGDLVKPMMLKTVGVDGSDDSDQQLNLNGRWFRILRLENNGNQDAGTYESRAVVTPLSDYDVAALGLEP